MTLWLKQKLITGKRFIMNFVFKCSFIHSGVGKRCKCLKHSDELQMGSLWSLETRNRHTNY